MSVTVADRLYNLYVEASQAGELRAEVCRLRGEVDRLRGLVAVKDRQVGELMESLLSLRREKGFR